MPEARRPEPNYAALRHAPPRYPVSVPFSGRRKIAAFIVLGSCLVALAVALNIGWILLNWREGLLLILGIVFFAVIITGLVLNTIFLVREVRRNEQHDTFINAVTHELKTPLASIRLYLETLQRRDLDAEKRQEFYRVMLEDSDRLLRLVEQVLHAARIPRLGLVHRFPVDMRPLVRESLETARWRHHLPDGAFEFHDSLPGEVPATVVGDPEELKLALSNLIDNAVKYSGPDVHVAVELAVVEPNRIAVRVRDRGIGISPNELKRIFRRFYRIPGVVATRVKGTGLGLFIVRSVARKHGGTVSAESEGPGRGSTFTLWLPVAQSR
jgi:two-component system, OmpR family, sensor histidine kinase SenX3